MVDDDGDWAADTHDVGTDGCSDYFEDGSDAMNLQTQVPVMKMKIIGMTVDLMDYVMSRRMDMMQFKIQILITMTTITI